MSEFLLTFFLFCAALHTCAKRQSGEEVFDLQGTNRQRKDHFQTAAVSLHLYQKIVESSQTEKVRKPLGCKMLPSQGSLTCCCPVMKPAFVRYSSGYEFLLFRFSSNQVQDVRHFTEPQCLHQLKRQQRVEFVISTDVPDLQYDPDW